MERRRGQCAGRRSAAGEIGAVGALLHDSGESRVSHHRERRARGMERRTARGLTSLSSVALDWQFLHVAPCVLALCAQQDAQHRVSFSWRRWESVSVPTSESVPTHHGLGEEACRADEAAHGALEGGGLGREALEALGEVAQLEVAAVVAGAVERAAGGRELAVGKGARVLKLRGEEGGISAEEGVRHSAEEGTHTLAAAAEAARRGRARSARERR